MDFTREPIIETVVSAREGCKLAIRNSKGVSQEEYFVDAIEVVSFGNAFFYRSQERPKSFLVPVSDYEVLEIRETRMVLKTPVLKGQKSSGTTKTEKKTEVIPEKSDKPEKKRERRKSRRRAKGSEDENLDDASSEEKGGEEKTVGGGNETEPSTKAKVESSPTIHAKKMIGSGLPPSLSVAPPKELISDTLRKYKEDELYRGAFFVKDETTSVVSAPSTETSKESPKEAPQGKASEQEGATVAAPEDAQG